MRLIENVLPRTHRLYIIGDIHLGNAAMAHNRLIDTIDRIKSDKQGYCINLGDNIEAIVCDDKRFQFETCETPLPMQQANKIIEIFDPIKKQLLVVMKGNHEYSVSKFGDISSYIASSLDCSYGGYICKLDIKDQKETMYKAFCFHGKRAIGSIIDDPDAKKAAMKLRLKRLFRDQVSDCCLMIRGHNHLSLVKEPSHDLCMSDNGESEIGFYRNHTQTGNYIHPDSRWYIANPSFLRTRMIGVDTYSEMGEYPPVEIGYTIIHVKDAKIERVEPVLYE